MIQQAAEAFPLYWPDGWARTKWRKEAPYKVGHWKAVKPNTYRADWCGEGRR